MDFAYKAVLTATAVAFVMLAARTFGDRIAGLLAGLPFTTVPALIWTGVEQGAAFAAQVAVGSVVGCCAVAVFALVYDRAARRFGAGIAMLLGLGALLASASFVHGLSADVALASGLAALAGIIALALMGRDPVADATPSRRPCFGIALTAVSAGAVSALLSALALGLSAPLAGLLAALPVVGAATLAVEHAGRGRDAVTPFLRGYVVTSLGKAAFGAIFAICVVPSGIACALGVALLLGGMLCGIGNRWLDAPPLALTQRRHCAGESTSAAAPPARAAEFDDTVGFAYVGIASTIYDDGRITAPARP